MKSSRREAEFGCISMMAGIAVVCANVAHASVALSLDWEPKTLPYSGRVVPNDANTMASDQLKKALDVSASARAAAFDRTGRKEKEYEIDLSFKLRIDGRQYYLAPVEFMTKSKPDEVCHPSRFVNTPTYLCDEGQRHTQDCHIFIFNDRFQEVGYHRIAVNEPYQFFCNAVPGVGTGNKALNELLFTVQYFPIDRKAASKVSEIGSSWIRMTTLLRLKLGSDGTTILIEQDDSCLKNPNRIEAIPDARRLLKKCAATAQAPRRVP